MEQIEHQYHNENNAVQLKYIEVSMWLHQQISEKGKKTSPAVEWRKDNCSWSLVCFGFLSEIMCFCQPLLFLFNRNLFVSLKCLLEMQCWGLQACINGMWSLERGHTSPPQHLACCLFVWNKPTIIAEYTLCVLNFNEQFSSYSAGSITAFRCLFNWTSESFAPLLLLSCFTFNLAIVLGNNLFYCQFEHSKVQAWCAPQKKDIGFCYPLALKIFLSWFPTVETALNFLLSILCCMTFSFVHFGGSGGLLAKCRRKIIKSAESI